jgi:hypothetical protein
LIYLISRHEKTSWAYRISRRCFHIFAGLTLLSLLVAVGILYL